ncbi:MAG TPA: hypothetical protein VE135_10830 [Pyrinomonadaceae bacterium]|nr:hypothetical protein [Pyrinomonadaceae bacterium]
MNQIKMRMLQVLCIAALLFGFAQSHPAVAQTPTPTPTPAPAAAPGPQWLSITIVIVKPDMMTEFQNYMKNTTNPALKKGGLKWRGVWQSTLAAGDAFEFVLVAPVEKFADFDGPSPIEKGLGAQGLAAWQAKAGILVSSVHRYLVRTRPDLSFEVNSSAPPKIAVVTSIHVAPNRNNDFENFVKNDYLPVMKQAQVSYLVSQTIFGGDPNEYVALTMRQSFADLDKGPVIVQVLGQEASDKLLQKLPAGTVTHLERSISRFIPELSIMPEK